MKFEYSDSYDPEKTRELVAVLRWIGKLVGILVVVSLVEYFFTGAVTFRGWIAAALTMFSVHSFLTRKRKVDAFSIDEVIEFVKRFLEDADTPRDWNQFISNGESGDPFLNDAWEVCRKCILPLSVDDKKRLSVMLADLEGERIRRTKY